MEWAQNNAPISEIQLEPWPCSYRSESYANVNSIWMWCRYVSPISDLWRLSVTLTFQVSTWILCATFPLNKMNNCVKYFKTYRLLSKIWRGHKILHPYLTVGGQVWLDLAVTDQGHAHHTTTLYFEHLCEIRCKAVLNIYGADTKMGQANICKYTVKPVLSKGNHRK